MLSKVYTENVSSIFINKLTKYKIHIFFSGFTGYVQRVDRNRKSQQGFTYYFDIILQTAVDQTQMIRIMISSMDDTTKSQLFKDKQKAQQPITITNLRVVQSGMVFMHQNSIVKDVSTMAIPFKYVPPAAPPITSVADVLKTKRQGDMVTVSGLIRWEVKLQHKTLNDQ